MTRIIAIANQKGGVAKTTTAINLSSSLAKLNRSVLLIDLDPQGNTSRGIGVDSSIMSRTIFDVLTNKYDINKVIKKTCMPNLSLIPANLRLASTESKLGKSMLKTQYILRDAIKKLDVKYDYIIIDCPPAIGVLNTNGLTAAHSVLIPVQCEYFAMEGLAQVISTINRVQTNYNKNLKIEGFLLTMLESRSKLGLEVIEQVRGLFRESTYNVVIPRNVSISEASAMGVPVLKYKPTSAGSQAYLQLGREVIDANE